MMKEILPSTRLMLTFGPSAVLFIMLSHRSYRCVDGPMHKERDMEELRPWNTS